MATNIEREQAFYVPTDALDLYPEADGRPMEAGDFQRNQMVWILRALKAHFSQDPTVYVSGNIFMYYMQGFPKKSIVPDVLVSYGVGQKLRRSYRVWEEGKVPDFVMELSSKRTYQCDLNYKMDIYASLKIQNYFLFDVEEPYLPLPLMGFELIDGNYVVAPPGERGGFYSSALGLDFHLRDEGLGIYDPVTREWVKTREEAAKARIEAAKARIEQAKARQKAEAEVEQLREQLKRLQART